MRLGLVAELNGAAHAAFREGWGLQSQDHLVGWSPSAPPHEVDVVWLNEDLARSPSREAVLAWAGAGRMVVGVGEGFGWLCQVGLLPGTLTPAGSHTLAAEAVFVRVEGRATPLTGALPAGRVLRMSGCGYTYHCTELDRLEQSGRAILRYCDAAGGVVRATGSLSGIAGVSNDAATIMGVLPCAAAVSTAHEFGARDLMGALRSWLWRGRAA